MSPSQEEPVEASETQSRVEFFGLFELNSLHLPHLFEVLRHQIQVVQVVHALHQMLGQQGDLPLSEVDRSCFGDLQAQEHLLSQLLGVFIAGILELNLVLGELNIVFQRVLVFLH